MNRKHTGNKNASGCDKYVHYCFDSGLAHVYQIRRSVFSGSDLLNFIFQFIPVGNLEIQFFLIILVGKTHEIVVAVLVFQYA